MLLSQNKLYHLLKSKSQVHSDNPWWSHKDSSFRRNKSEERRRKISRTWINNWGTSFLKEKKHWWWLKCAKERQESEKRGVGRRLLKGRSKGNDKDQGKWRGRGRGKDRNRFNKGKDNSNKDKMSLKWIKKSANKDSFAPAAFATGRDMKWKVENNLGKTDIWSKKSIKSNSPLKNLHKQTNKSL